MLHAKSNRYLLDLEHWVYRYLVINILFVVLVDTFVMVQIRPTSLDKFNLSDRYIFYINLFLGIVNFFV